MVPDLPACPPGPAVGGARRQLRQDGVPRRSPAHCIEYVHLIQWGQERPSEDFDADVEEHMAWVFGQAAARAQQYGIQVPSWLTRPLAACSAPRASRRPPGTAQGSFHQVLLQGPGRALHAATQSNV